MSTLSLLLSATFMVAPPAEQPTDNNEDADQAALVSSEGETSVYEFADVELTGEHLTPDGDLIPWRQPPRHVSLISLRGHFLPELITLARDV